MRSLTSKVSIDILRGTTRDIYRLMLKNGKSFGVREIQRELNLSSPSVARYHLFKLENAGLIKHENGNYVVSKVFLENNVRINHVIIPRFLFYAVLAIIILMIDFTILGPTIITCAACNFKICATILFFLIFSGETVRIWLKGSL